MEELRYKQQRVNTLTLATESIAKDIKSAKLKEDRAYETYLQHRLIREAFEGSRDRLQLELDALKKEDSV